MGKLAAPATMDTSNTSIASGSEAGKSIQSVRTGITNSDQQTLQSEAMSVLTEFISQARTEDAERRREDKEERRIEREERKAEAAIRQRNEEMRQRNEERRDENNRLMFQSMMAMMAQNTTGQSLVSQQTILTDKIGAGKDTTDDPPTPPQTDGRNKEGKRRKTNEEEAAQAGTTPNTQDTGKAMEVEQLQPAQQNHDTIQGGNNPLIR